MNKTKGKERRRESNNNKKEGEKEGKKAMKAAFDFLSQFTTTLFLLLCLKGFQTK